MNDLGLKRKVMLWGNYVDYYVDYYVYFCVGICVRVVGFGSLLGVCIAEAN